MAVEDNASQRLSYLYALCPVATLTQQRDTNPVNMFAITVGFEKCSHVRRWHVARRMSVLDVPDCVLCNAVD